MKKIVVERTFDASLEEVWDLWTTKDGIESWWGPEGFSVTVERLDLRPGGEMRYSMTATGREQIEFMKRAGMPLSSALTVTFTEVVPLRRLAYTNHVDFVPGVPPYPVATLVEMSAAAGGVRMVLTHDAMHDEEWTERARMGWESEIGKLAKLLAGRRVASD